MLISIAFVALQQGPEVSESLVRGRSNELVGIAESASEGEVGRAELDRRPLLRPGEVLETVPGLVLTQHSGAGKANQFFLRGFNLDHGTDFATRLNGVPLNLPSHGHGQGYTDLNPLIPELVAGIRFRKGPYFASVGDFASAGSAELLYLDGCRRRSPGSRRAASGTSAGSRRIPSPSARGACSSAPRFCTRTGRGTCPRTTMRRTVSCAGRVGTSVPAQI